LKKRYLLTNIDPGLWKEYKIACAEKEISIRKDMVEHIKAVVEDYHIYKTGFYDRRLRKKGGLEIDNGKST